MIDKEFLNLLCCPETKQSLSELTKDKIDKLNSLQKQSKLTFISKEPVIYSLSSALIREDQQVIYPIREDIPVLLVEEAIDASFLD